MGVQRGYRRWVTTTAAATTEPDERSVRELLVDPTLSPTPWLAGMALASAGFAFLAAITSVTTRMQRGIDEDVRGRVMALWGVTFLGSRPIAALVDGGLADLVGPRLATVSAACVAFAGAALLAWDGRRERTQGAVGTR